MATDFIPLSVPNLKGRELELVTTAVETEWVSTGGPYVSQFEENIAEYVNAKGAVACQSGTAGLHTALMVLGVTPDDLVLVPALTFIAAVNPVRYMNAEPLFLDCDSSLCVDPVKLERFCEEESGVGVVEIILVLVVIVGLILIFKKQLTSLVNKAFSNINDKAGTL